MCPSGRLASDQHPQLLYVRSVQHVAGDVSAGRKAAIQDFGEADAGAGELLLYDGPVALWRSPHPKWPHPEVAR